MDLLTFGIVPLIIIASLFSIFIATLYYYRKCPSDKILVIYGMIGKGNNGQRRTSKCVHGGAAFIWPVVQDFKWLSLIPMQIDIDLRGALSKQNIRVNIPASFTIAVSNSQDIMQNAAERLLDLDVKQIQKQAEDIIFGQLRQVIATMSIEDINADRDKFIQNVAENLCIELNKIGLDLINVNIKDITDESGYIEALGKKAAAIATEQAKIDVAEQEKAGETGKALADRERRIQVATANSEAVKGENLALIVKADSDADRRESEAKAQSRAIAAESVQTTNAEKEGYEAQIETQRTLIELNRQTEIASNVVPAEIAKQKVIIQAEAEAEKLRIEAEGAAKALYAKMKAEAEGNYEILKQMARGFGEAVEAVGGSPEQAVMMMIADKLENLMRIQVDAISGINIDKITVWDSGSNSEGDTSTAGFVKGMMKSVPPIHEMFKMSGMELPKWLGSEGAEPALAAQAATPEPATTEPTA